jgi:hypothetical protein
MSDLYKVKSGKLKLKGESDSHKKKHKDKKRKHDHESKEESKKQKIEEAADISRHGGWWRTKEFK